MRHDQIATEEEVKEFIQILKDSQNFEEEFMDITFIVTTLAALIGIAVGFILFVLGMFSHSDFYAISLPLWIFSTVYITRGLTFDFMRDIKEALELSR